MTSSAGCPVAGSTSMHRIVDERCCTKTRLGRAASHEGADEQRVAADEAVIRVPWRLELKLGLRLGRRCVAVAAAALRAVLRERQRGAANVNRTQRHELLAGVFTTIGTNAGSLPCAIVGWCQTAATLWPLCHGVLHLNR